MPTPIAMQARVVSPSTQCPEASVYFRGFDREYEHHRNRNWKHLVHGSWSLCDPVGTTSVLILGLPNGSRYRRLGRKRIGNGKFPKLKKRSESYNACRVGRLTYPGTLHTQTSNNVLSGTFPFQRACTHSWQAWHSCYWRRRDCQSYLR